jgi:CHAT domain-containing protein
LRVAERAIAGDANRGITARDAAALEQSAPKTQLRFLVAAVGEASPEDRREILSAQADYIMAVARRELGQADTDAALSSAEEHLANVDSPPGWLGAAIAEERSKAAARAGDYGRAIQLARRGLSDIRKLAPRSRSEGHLTFVLADAQAGAGQLPEALKTGREAVAIYAEQGDSPGYPAVVAAPHARRLFDVWNRTKDPAVGDEYFEVLSLVWDGTASRAMAQMAARLGGSDSVKSVVRSFQDASRDFRRELAKQERLLADPDVTPQAIALAKNAVAAAQAARTKAEDAARAQSPRYVELLSPKMNGSDLRKVLTDREGYLRVVMADGSGFGALVVHGHVTPFVVPLRQEEAERLVSRVRDSVKVHRNLLPDFDLDAATRLHRALIAPVGAEVDQLDTLHVDAGPVLSALPFGVLTPSKPNPAELQRLSQTHDYRGVDWLARRHAVDVSLGAAAFRRVRMAKRASTAVPVAAFGGFVPDPAAVSARLVRERRITESCQAAVADALATLPALAGSAEEAHTAAAILSPTAEAVIGASFTDDAILKDKSVGQAEVLIIATHGVLGLTDCLPEPALLTSLGETGNGLLEASRVLDRSLVAKLVVLSACDTAGGGHSDTAVTGLIGGGEALSGLARSFIYAGGANVLASQWPVSDTAARRETQALIESAQSGDPLVRGLAKSQALLFDQKDTAHPFFWASFVLLGDGSVTLDRHPARQ